MRKHGGLFVLSGPSGVGKDTVLARFLEGRPGCVESVSMTTRPPRPGEREGVSYYFTEKQHFQEMITQGKMLEYAVYADDYYGTPAEPVERLRSEGKHVFLVIEVNGALAVRKKCPDAVLVFLMPPSVEALRQRLTARGTESPEKVNCRMATAVREMAQAELYDHIIVNDTVEESCAHLEEILGRAAKKGRVTQNTHVSQEECIDA